MAIIHEFRGPDGRIHQVRGADGSSPAEAYEHLQQQLAQQAPPEPGPMPVGEARPMSGLEMWRARMQERLGPTVAGVARPMMKAAQGVQQLLHKGFGAPPGAAEAAAQDVAEVERLSGQLGPKGRFLTGTAGELLQSAPFAMGGLGAARGVQAMAPRLTKGTAAWTVPAAGESAALAGFRAVATPGAPEERARAAGSEFLASMTGHAGGRALEKAARGLRLKPEARQLLEEGVPLTPGQAAESPLPQFLEERFSYVPGVAGPTARLQKRALEQWNRNLAKQAASRGETLGANADAITEAGIKGARQAKDQLGKAYNNLYGELATDRAQRMITGMIPDLETKALQEARRRMGRRAQDRTMRDIREYVQELRKNMDPRGYQRFTERLKDAIKSAEGRREDTEAEVLEYALERWKTLLSTVSRGFRHRLGDIDLGYAEAEILRKAGKGDAEARKFFTPGELSKARQDSRLFRAANEAANEASMGQLRGKKNVFGQVIVGGIGGLGGAMLNPGATAGIAGTSLLAGQTLLTEPMRRMLTGTAGWQRAVGPITRRQAQRLRSYMGRTAAATETEE